MKIIYALTIYRTGLLVNTIHLENWISQTHRRERNGRSQFFSAYYSEVPKAAQREHQWDRIPITKVVNDFES
jgi:hypothetical protein